MTSPGSAAKRENAQLHFEINPGRLAEIIGEAVLASTEVVNVHLNALSDENLSRPIEGNGSIYRFRGPERSLEQRRALHENWILAKAFQDLLRAVRHALEEAHVMATLFAKRHRATSSGTLADFIRPFQSKAAGLPFPGLLDAVNGLLDPKLEFSDSYRSLQAARNCLEHRAGVVNQIDTKGAAALLLSIPRLKLFYFRGNEEIELLAGERVDSGDDRAEVEIMAKLEIRRRSIAVGQRLSFSALEFNEIAFACNYLGQQLATRLLKPTAVVSDV